MGDGRERSEDRSNDDATPIANTATGAMTPGKRTLTEQLSPAPANAKPGAVGGEAAETAGKKPTIPGTIIEGGALSDADVDAINEAAPKVPKQFRRYVAYSGVIKVGGSLAWRANNPGNLRDADTKIGTVHGAVGTFAVFASMEAGRAAQRALYLNKYGSMKVRDAIEKLTPPSENDTATYLKRLEQAGVDLDKDVKSQIDTLMSAVEANEGMISGVEIARSA
jgi:hypothetical protein